MREQPITHPHSKAHRVNELLSEQNITFRGWGREEKEESEERKKGEEGDEGEEGGEEGEEGE